MDSLYYEICMNKYDAIARERYLKIGMGEYYLKNRLKRCLSLTGFTLVEVMMALIITSVSLTFIYTAFTTIYDTHLRVKNYNQSILLSMEQFWKLEEAMSQSPEVNIASFSDKSKEGLCLFQWEFEEGEPLENYPLLSEIKFNIKWAQGKRKGSFQAGTYLRQILAE